MESDPVKIISDNLGSDAIYLKQLKRPCSLYF